MSTEQVKPGYEKEASGIPDPTDAGHSLLALMCCSLSHYHGHGFRESYTNIHQGAMTISSACTIAADSFFCCLLIRECVVCNICFRTAVRHSKLDSLLIRDTVTDHCRFSRGQRKAVKALNQLVTTKHMIGC